MQNELSDRAEILVRFNEADPLGIVWHGHYIRYFEDGRESFGKKYGVGYLDFFNHGYIVPIVHVTCDFKRSLKFGDKVIVETKFIPTVAAKMKFSYRLFKVGDEKRLIATGTSIQVFLDRHQSLLQLTNPPFFEDWKKKQGLI
jgi:acyl-CoA thioester hydrolase